MSDEYTCKRCGEICDVYEDEDHPGHAESWCDKCNDYPGGWLGSLDDKTDPPCVTMGIDFLTDRIDRAHDEYKDRKLFGDK